VKIVKKKSIKMPVERRGIRALQIWCRRVTESYDNVNIIDMTTSWKDGLAFCALIHHFRPNIIDYDGLKPEDVYDNNDLAYKVAEEELGIPSLLDPQDMVDSSVPDKFSIVTYVSQFYHLLKEEDGSRSPSLAFRNSESDSCDISSSTENTPVGTPKSIPRRLFTSSSLILSNNKFSPLNSPVSQSPEIKENIKPEIISSAKLEFSGFKQPKQEVTSPIKPVMTSQISCSELKKKFENISSSQDVQTFHKSTAGITISSVCAAMERKAKISEEKDS